MKFSTVFLCGILGLFLAACTPTGFTDLVPALNPSSDSMTEDQAIKQQTKAICSWTAAAGLPHRNPSRRAVLDSNMTRAEKKEYLEFDKQVVGTSKARECLCSDDEALNRRLQCTR